jgi:hypothetical protein
LVTELGKVPSSSIPVILKECGKLIYVDKIALPVNK